MDRATFEEFIGLRARVEGEEEAFIESTNKHHILLRLAVVDGPDGAVEWVHIATAPNDDDPGSQITNASFKRAELETTDGAQYIATNAGVIALRPNVDPTLEISLTPLTPQ